MVFALSRTGMLRSYIESYEVADLLREVRRKHVSSCDFCTLSMSTNPDLKPSEGSTVFTVLKDQVVIADL